MPARIINVHEADDLSAAELLAALGSRPEGLTQVEVTQRLAEYGPNALQEKTRSALGQLLGYFWGPIPWMIEAAAVLSAIARDFKDLLIVLVLLVFNAAIGFSEERKAANALDALKDQLALRARALRDGQWHGVAATDLVPGDVVRVRPGDVIPADVKLLAGDYLSVDQSALTGESLPVTKQAGQTAYSGSVAKQGEMVALVTGTGANTFFGRTARLVTTAGVTSHFQKAVIKIGDFLIMVAAGLSLLLILVELHRGEPVIRLVQFVLILVIASIPVAMPAVLSVSMALGALALSHKKAIVSRLQSIEEMAGVDILCSDKTGTLTQNTLTLGETVTFAAPDAQALVLAGALASKAENEDVIDLAVIGGLADPSLLRGYRQESFIPFDPVSKRTEATVGQPAARSTFQVTKGAPQVIMKLCDVPNQDRVRATDVVNEFATRGFRALGVARRDQDGPWQFLGLLSLFDPPREDSAETIAQAKKHGIAVKMITGDNVAIGREIAGRLGMSTAIHPAGEFFSERGVAEVVDIGERIEDSDGFAEVFPEHKYGIVKALQQRGHLVAMTGDGVNDAPALKQADVGVAVSGATDAARAAAALILTEPGLSVIIRAVEEARRVFERMMSYAVYRIAMTIDIMVFVVLAMLVVGIRPLTAIMIILLALLDDVPIMAIARDNTRVDPRPVTWNMPQVLSVSGVLGSLAVIQTFGLLYLGDRVLDLELDRLRTLVFLQLVVGGHLMLFLTRNPEYFWRPPHPSWQLFTTITATQVLAVLLCGFGWLVPQLSWWLIGLVWGYNLAWMLAQDAVKLGVYRVLGYETRYQQALLGPANQPLQPRVPRS